MVTTSVLQKKTNNSDFIDRLEDIDWAFRNVRNDGMHGIHWYPATFLSAIPGTLIPLLSSPGDLIIDPFCGSSTTGVEAVRLGRKYIGFDTNPVAVMISQAKNYFPTKRTLENHFNISQVTEIFAQRRRRPSQHPQKAELLRWYHPQTFSELDFLLESLSHIQNTELRTCLQAIFSSILKTTSSQSKHWGWVCDNVRPKDNEIQYKDAFSAFNRVFNDYLRSIDILITDMKNRDVDTRRESLRKRATISHRDCISGLNKLGGNSVQLMLTSPPYYGVADYIKSQRLSYLWFDHPNMPVLGHSFEDFSDLRRMETGSRSYRHRLNSFDLYMDYMQKFFHSAHRVIAHSGHLALVIGESKSRQATTEKVIQCASEAGFNLIYRKVRDIKDTRRRLMAKVKGEYILIFNPKY